MTNDRIHEDYRGHVLIVAFRIGKWRGRILKNRDIVDDIEGDDRDSVYQSLKEIVDQIIEEKIGRRGEASPSAQEYIEAFKSIMSDIHDGQFAMLKAHYHAPKRKITATQLAQAAHYDGYEAANLQYGLLGQMLADEMHLEPRLATYAIATDDPNHSGDEWLWVMRPEVAEALEHLGLTV